MWLELSGDLRRDFWGIQNNLRIRGSARVSRPRSSANKVQPNLFCYFFNNILFNNYLTHYIASIRFIKPAI